MNPAVRVEDGATEKTVVLSLDYAEAQAVMALVGMVSCTNKQTDAIWQALSNAGVDHALSVKHGGQLVGALTVD